MSRKYSVESFHEKLIFINTDFDLGENEINQMIQEADLDGDGTISFEEFILMIFHNRHTQQDFALQRAFKVTCHTAIVLQILTFHK